MFEEQKYHQAYFLNAIVFAKGIEGGFSEACALVFSATFPIYCETSDQQDCMYTVIVVEPSFTDTSSLVVVVRGETCTPSVACVVLIVRDGRTANFNDIQLGRFTKRCAREGVIKQ